LTSRSAAVAYVYIIMALNSELHYYGRTRVKSHRHLESTNFVYPSHPHINHWITYSIIPKDRPLRITR
jgi:hypothetical protein